MVLKITSLFLPESRELLTYHHLPHSWPLHTHHLLALLPWECIALYPCYSIPAITSLFRFSSFFFLNSLCSSNPLLSLQDVFSKFKINHFTLVLKIFQQTPYCFEDVIHMFKPIYKALHKLAISFQHSLPYPLSPSPPPLIIQN